MKSSLQTILLGLALGAIATLAWMALRPSRSQPASVLEPLPNAGPQALDAALPAPAIDAAAPVMKEPRIMNDLPPFSTTSLVAQTWMREEGYTVEELLQAQQRARESGVSEEVVNDPGVVRRFLPPRYMTTVQIQELVVPETVRAGEPIPFTIRGRIPQEGFEFLRFRSSMQGPIVRLDALGFTRVMTEGALTGTTELQGQLDPLPPGLYRVVIAELGPRGSFPFTVEE